MRRKVKVKERTEEYVEREQCSHYWIIEMAKGKKSRGVCKYCGEYKDFLNAMPDFTVVKRQKNPLDLPAMPEVEVDEERKS